MIKYIVNSGITEVIIDEIALDHNKWKFFPLKFWFKFVSQSISVKILIYIISRHLIIIVHIRIEIAVTRG